VLDWGYREEEYSAFGISKEGAPKRFNECLTAVKMLWTQDVVNFEGKYFKLKNVRLTIKPLQKPYPPFGLQQIAIRQLRRLLSLDTYGMRIPM